MTQHTPTRTIVLALSLALTAMAARAQSPGQDAPLPATPPPAPPPPTATAAPASPDPAALAAPANPADASVALPSAPIDLSVHPQIAPPVDALQSASSEVKGVARWIVNARDNVGLPFLLIDKVNATVYAFGPAGQLQGKAPALLGMAHGDRLLAPSDARMGSITPQNRITPAGRFVSRLAIDSHGKELLVIDYQNSISLHPVVKGTPAEHRAERLASGSSQDNRISFGCINVPPAFYTDVVSPAFTHTKGVVYILPEMSPASPLFGFPGAGALVSALKPAPALDAPTVQEVQASSR